LAHQVTVTNLLVLKNTVKIDKIHNAHALKQTHLKWPNLVNVLCFDTSHVFWWWIVERKYLIWLLLFVVHHLATPWLFFVLCLSAGWCTAWPLFCCVLSDCLYLTVVLVSRLIYLHILSLAFLRILQLKINRLLVFWKISENVISN